QVVDVGEAAVALARAFEDARIDADEVVGGGGPAVLPAVVGDVGAGRRQRAVVAERERVLDGERGGDVGGAEVDVAAVVVRCAVQDRDVAEIAVVVEAVVDVAGGDAADVTGVVAEILVIAAPRLEAVAVASADRAVLQLAVVDRPTVFVRGRDAVGGPQVAVPAVVQVVPGATTDEAVARAYVELGGKAVGVLEGRISIIERIAVHDRIIRGAVAEL